jgi:hypothetical protein
MFTWLKVQLALILLFIFTFGCMFDDSGKNPSSNQSQQTPATKFLLVGYWDLMERPLIDTVSDIWKDYYTFFADSTYNRTSYRYCPANAFCAPFLENGRYTMDQNIITFEVDGSIRQRTLSILSNSCIMFFVPDGDTSKYIRRVPPDSTQK